MKAEKPKENTLSPDAKKGWEAFRRIGQNAAQGKSTDSSVEHDHYIYGTKKRKKK